MKRLTILSLFILLLAACNSPQESSPTEDAKAGHEEMTEEEQGETEESTESEESKENEESAEQDETESLEEEPPVKQEENNNSSKADDQTEASGEEELIDLTHEIFDAQNEKDYEFLQSILSKGSKLDEENDKFIFENVTYPHEQEFLTEEDIGELEFRYTHEEDADATIVGYAAVNYETESSFTIDFQFIREDGNWKMNDMDINK